MPHLIGTCPSQPAIEDMRERRNEIMVNKCVKWNMLHSPHWYRQPQVDLEWKYHVSTRGWPLCYRRNGALTTAPHCAGCGVACHFPCCAVPLWLSEYQDLQCIIRDCTLVTWTWQLRRLDCACRVINYFN